MRWFASASHKAVKASGRTVARPWRPRVNSSFVITTEALDTLAAEDRARGRCRVAVHQVARLVVVRGPVGIRDEVANLVGHRPDRALWELLAERWERCVETAQS